MRLEQLQYLIAIHKSHSINLASQELHIAQQSISKAIHNLEEELGAPLLERSNKGATLTKEGRLVLRHAEAIFSEIEQLHSELNHIRKKNSALYGTLRILYNNSFDYNLMIQSVKAFRKDHPKVQFIFQQRTTANILSFVCNNAADIGLFNISSDFHFNAVIAPEKLEKLNTRILSQDAMLVAVSSNSPLSKQHSITLSTVLKHPIVFYLNETDTNTELNTNWLIKLLSDHGSPNIIMTLDNLNPYINAIASDIGIGFLTRSSTNILPKSFFENIALIPFRPALSLDNICIHTCESSILPLINAYIPYLETIF